MKQLDIKKILKDLSSLIIAKGYNQSALEKEEKIITYVTDLQKENESTKELLHWAYEMLKVKDKQIPIHLNYNIANEKGKAAWEEYRDGMVDIEKCLSGKTNEVFHFKHH